MKKSFCVLFALIAYLTLCFSGCAKINFNAKIISEGYTVNSEWLSQNYTLGAFDQESGEYYNEAPRNRTHAIKTEQELKVVFSDFEEVDLSKKMIVVYCYTCVYGRDNYLIRVENVNLNLVIEFDIKKAKPGVGDACMPYTRVAVFMLDKVHVNEVTVIYHGN